MRTNHIAFTQHPLDFIPEFLGNFVRVLGTASHRVHHQRMNTSLYSTNETFFSFADFSSPSSWAFVAGAAAFPGSADFCSPVVELIFGANAQ